MKKAKKKTAIPRKHESRATKILAFLGRARDAKTTREICEGLKLTAKDAKFVSSILIDRREHKAVAIKKKICSITGRKVNAYVLRAG